MLGRPIIPTPAKIANRPMYHTCPSARMRSKQQPQQHSSATIARPHLPAQSHKSRRSFGSRRGVGRHLRQFGTAQPQLPHLAQRVGYHLLRLAHALHRPPPHRRPLLTHRLSGRRRAGDSRYRPVGGLRRRLGVGKRRPVQPHPLPHRVHRCNLARRSHCRHFQIARHALRIVVERASVRAGTSRLRGGARGRRGRDGVA
mmetsp:Transcript_26204/g.84622  ORF Transcript_26204/g.84622 Transcript_26204/m.84622 type:complete len:200 (-) Transcript_26204:1401-2000(-)